MFFLANCFLGLVATNPDLMAKLRAFKRQQLLMAQNVPENLPTTNLAEVQSDYLRIRGVIGSGVPYGLVETTSSPVPVRVIVDTGSTSVLFPKLPNSLRYSPLSAAETEQYFAQYPDDKNYVVSCPAEYPGFVCVKHGYGSVTLMGALGKTAVCSATWENRPFCFLTLTTGILLETEDSPLPDNDFDLSVGILGVGFGKNGFGNTEILAKAHAVFPQRPRSLYFKVTPDNQFEATVGTVPGEGFVWLPLLDVSVLAFLEINSFSIGDNRADSFAPFTMPDGTTYTKTLALLDTGTNLLVVPEPVYEKVVAVFDPFMKAAQCETYKEGYSYVYCCSGEVKGSFSMDLGSAVIQAPVADLFPFSISATKCGLVSGSSGFPLFIIGMPYFRSFETYIDGDQNRLGLKANETASVQAKTNV